MHLCDTNVWLALTLSGHSHHAASRDWLDSIGTPAGIHFCRATQQSLLRLLTNSAVLGAYGNPPLTNEQAWGVYEAFTADPRIVMADREPAGLEVQWKTFASRDAASPKLWMDAYLAAFAHTAELQLITHDAGFRQFDGLNLLVLEK